MKNAPKTSPEGAAEAARRKERLAAALRENLKKRKEQARGRGDPGKDGGPGAA
jgi:hypothetical protein